MDREKIQKDIEAMFDLKQDRRITEEQYQKLIDAIIDNLVRKVDY